MSSSFFSLAEYNTVTRGDEYDSNNNQSTCIRLEGIVWKRKPGLGKLLSDTVGVGSERSWKRRYLILHVVVRETEGEDDGHNNNDLDSNYNRGSSKLCYYDVENEAHDQPRGTLLLLPDRLSITTTTIEDLTGETSPGGDQPTPYALSVKDNIDGTKWKLCFDDRTTLMRWLVTLTDALVDSTVRAYNAHTTFSVKDDGNSHHGLYEDMGKCGSDVFDVVKDVLMGNDHAEEKWINERHNDQHEVNKKNLTSRRGERLDKFNSVVDEGSDDDTCSNQSDYKMSATKSVSAKSTTSSSKNTTFQSMPPPALVDALEYFSTLVIINIIILYIRIASIPWWEIVVSTNLCLYACLPPLTPSTLRREKYNASSSLQLKKVTALDSKSNQGEGIVSSTATPRGCIMKDSKQKQKPQENSGTTSEEPGGMGKGKQNNVRGHERWAISAPNVDLSGSWTLLADDAFKAQYDMYLKELGFNIIIRQLACSLIVRTYETTKQTEGGRSLYLKSNNPKGSWERILISSGYPDIDKPDYVHQYQEEKKDGIEGEDFQEYTRTRIAIKTADSEDVVAEAWWENQGTVHRSWLRGSTKYGGGDHESKRYLQDGGTVLVCESVFHRRNNSKAAVRWRFKRDVK